MKHLLLLLLTIFFTTSAAAAAPSDLFPRPAALEPAVAFWMRVYTEVDSGSGLIHDSQNLDIVYDVIQLPANSNKQSRKSEVRRARERYKRILLELARGKRSGLSRDAQRVLALWPHDVSNQTLRDAVHRVRFQLGQANKFRDGWIRSGAWLTYIHDTLSSRGLPPELSALPHVESSFNPDAYSHAGAAGLWQFMRSTGRRFMRIDHVVDERMDPFLSTTAAAQLLEYNYAALGNWPLAVTAYNHGVKGMARAVRQVGSKDIEVIVERYRSRNFQFASRNFYAAFLAAMEADANAEAYFGPIQRTAPLDTVTVQIPDYMPITTLQRVLDVDHALLKRYNPALRGTVWNGRRPVPRDFPLRLPRHHVPPDAAAALSNVRDDQRFVGSKSDQRYRVQRGDTLSDIAARYGVRVGELARVNDLPSRHRIEAGQILYLPEHDVSAKPSRRHAVRKAPTDGIYTVQRGDTVSSISKRFGVDAEALLAINQIRDRDRLSIGQPLRLHPAPDEMTVSPAAHNTSSNDTSKGVEGVAVIATQPTLPDDPADYSISSNRTIVVQVQETLGHYADWLEIPTQRLRALNRMRFGEHVVVGQRLRLDLSRVDRDTFMQRRLLYHQTLKDEFFKQYQIGDTRTHTVRHGESLWTLSTQKYQVPLWLLRQYNPDLDLRQVHPGVQVTVPIVEPVDSEI